MAPQRLKPLEPAELEPAELLSEKRDVTSEYLKDIGVCGKIYRTAKRLCTQKQRPFLWLDKATVHTSAITKAELDRAFQAGEIPDANDGDVGLFPFMRRHLSGLGEHAALDEIEAGFKSAWTHVKPQVCKAIRARVFRNVHMNRAQKGGNFYNETSTKGCLGV